MSTLLGESVYFVDMQHEASDEAIHAAENRTSVLFCLFQPFLTTLDVCAGGKLFSAHHV